ncbi:MAG: histidine kinase [Chitinophagaceae bacterium]|nr:histidine kinase [Chitinophagaceae bacterium]
MRYTVIICCLAACLLSMDLSAQKRDSSYSPREKKSSKVKKAADNLKKALATDDEENMAREYETLANELINKGDYSKAEDYLTKAKSIYQRLKREDKVAAVTRDLAKVQELQEKTKLAIENYESAAKKTRDSNLERANLNDAGRLRTDNPQKQEALAQDNAVIFEKEGKKEEASNAYRQVAESQVLQNNTTEAIGNFKKAIEVSPDPKEIASLNNKIAGVYAAGNELDKAIALSETVLAEAKKGGDTEQQIDQLHILSEYYQQHKNFKHADMLLQEAYNLAVASGNTGKAKTSALLLAAFYKTQNRNEDATRTYQTFLNNLDSIIKKDSSLVDSKLFEVTEERIKELEKEKVLQNELMQKKTRFNYFLIGSVVLMTLLLIFIARALSAIRIKNKKIALQSLRREMNPHFIFNSLNSVNQYIAENNELEANKYLTSYSSLMRNVMENSGKDLVPLSVEIDQLKRYLELEHQRFSEKFDYTIDLPEEIDAEAILIPNMLIQPHLENAVWHGLRYRPGKGKLLLQFQKKGKTIVVIITDDGIGIAQSRLLKTDNQKQYQSRGISNTMERIGLLNKVYKTEISLKIEEIKEENITGTRVIINVPIITKR